MTATSVILSGGMPEINQFFGVEFKGLDRGFRIISKAEAAP
jgi:hypothetical protein